MYGCARHDCARANVFSHTGLPRNCDSIADGYVLVRSDLSCDYATLPCASAARKTCQRSNHSVFAYVAVVANLNQVVELHSAPEHCVAETASVTLVLHQGGSLAPDERPLMSLEYARPGYQPNGTPPFRVDVQWGRNNTVMTSGDFAGSAANLVRQPPEQK